MTIESHLMPDPSIGEPRRYLLPREAYISQAWFDREQTMIFARSWLYAALESDFEDTGDFVTVQAGHHPLFVIRDANGQLRAHYNICRHRGVRLLEGKGNAGRGVSCFYHRWHYELDGRLRSVTHADKFACIDKGQLGLKRASVAIWNGLVFVHADESPAESLDDWLADFPMRHGPWKPAELSEIQTVDHVVHANWKLFVENHVDGYHLFHLHAKSIEGLDHAKQQWRASGRHWTLTEPVSTPGELPEQLRSPAYRLPRIPGVGTDRDGSTVHLLFPTLAIAAGATYYLLVQLIPQGPAKTLIRTRVLGMKADATSLLLSSAFLIQMGVRKLMGRPAYEVMPTPQSDRGDFLGEDVYAAEAIQFAMNSDRFEVGPLALDYEDSILFFQRSVLAAMYPAPADS